QSDTYDTLSLNATATTPLSPLSLHDLFRSNTPSNRSVDELVPITISGLTGTAEATTAISPMRGNLQSSQPVSPQEASYDPTDPRSEEHTSELQSRENLVCRLLLENTKYETY